MDVVLVGGASARRGLFKAAGIFRIATELRNAGFTVQTLDRFLFCSDEYLQAFLESVITDSTLFIGVSTTMLQRSDAAYSHTLKGHQYFGLKDERFKQFVSYARSLNPNIQIVIGGPQVDPHCTPTIKPFCDFIDYCVTGQGETSVIALANHLKYGDELIYEEVDGFKFINDKAYPVTDYDNIAIEYEQGDGVSHGEATAIEVARGCVFKCKYCTYDLIGKSWGDMIKTKRSLKQEMERNYAEHGITTYICTDDTLNDSMEKVEFIHDVFTNLSFRPTFSGYFRLDILAKFKQQARLLKESGVWSMNFGIETMDKKAGALMGKGLGAERINDALRFLQGEFKDDVLLTGNFIIGLPGETVESMFSTLDYLLEPDCPLHGANFRPLSLSRHIKGFNSELYKQAERFGYIIDDKTDNWESPILDSDMATEITNQIFDTLKEKKNPHYKLIHTFYIIKLLNIGYTKQEIMAMIQNKPTTDFSWQEIRKRTKSVHKKYLERVLEMARQNNVVPVHTRRTKFVMPNTHSTTSLTPIAWKG